MGTYLLGEKREEGAGPRGIAMGVLTLVGLRATGIFLRKNEKRLKQLGLAEEKALARNP